ncbi:MAG: helix-turn-helix protein [Frankiaceae bacterium]|nr:helix-turn-helix protein [Frankiaceae bacterium]
MMDTESAMQVQTIAALGAGLRAARRARGLTQGELAARAGLSRQWVAGLEAGHVNASFDVIARLVEVLDLRLTLTDPAAGPEVESSNARTSQARVAHARSAVESAPATDSATAAVRRASDVDLDALLEQHRARRPPGQRP